MPLKPETFGSTIMVLGDFNPAIFTADWLHRNQLIGDGDRQEAIDSPNTLITHDVTVCETSWFKFQVVGKQLVLASSGALTPALKDLAEGILLLLPHTPVTAVGLNFHAHYQMTSESDWQKVGDVLAPKAIWSSLFDSSEYFAGLTNIQVRVSAGTAADAKKGPPDHLNLQVQPSNRLENGVYIMLNDHRGSFASEDNGSTAAERAAQVIAKDWERSWELASQKFEELLNNVIAS
ncbi:hypothetical protein SAMN04487785_102373 [Dyella jiangningensis]|uniref:hypothetical protein n=1 Tax=Dyella sp. AtDHG13 TaxID=1938897 RepID=UPI00088C20BE|nr:hypothetical protein [Dyella sp. AtDHG13]PXV60646.1 hypothetical protein BDW41_102373 [Dyella sp. AtDHG13]SDJ53604.1 hypothetical protein SAMN04487785_102373 [Dyella jiangningensis]